MTDPQHEPVDALPHGWHECPICGEPVRDGHACPLCVRYVKPEVKSQREDAR